MIILHEIVDPLFWARIGAALACGFILGLERQIKGKPVGIRTSILICLGTVTFIRLGILIGGDHQDPTRTLGQVITGVGFLGAGVIMNMRGTIIGVTSAAVVWLLAAVGCAIGTDQFEIAFVTSLVAISVLSGVQFMESRSKIFRRGVHAERVGNPQPEDIIEMKRRRF